MSKSIVTVKNHLKKAQVFYKLSYACTGSDDALNFLCARTPEFCPV